MADITSFILADHDEMWRCFVQLDESEADQLSGRDNAEARTGLVDKVPDRYIADQGRRQHGGDSYGGGQQGGG